MSLFLQQHAQAVWRRPQHIQQAIPPVFTAWLLDTSSLTQRLMAKSQGQLQVEVLQASIQRPHPSEWQALGIPCRQWAMVREVILSGRGVPWVYARTVIPLSTLHGPLRRLHYLGNKPLGEQLFADPSMRREPVEIAQLDAAQLPQTLCHHSPEACHKTWGRRSIFRVSNKPLLVSEVFLAQLFNQ